MRTLKNSVRLTGFLGSDPMVKKFDDNKTLARVSIAVNERYKDHRGEWLTDTQWHNLIFWGKQAVFAEKSLTKGCEISIEGKLINRSYVDKEGIDRQITDVIVMEVRTLQKVKKE